MGTLILSATAVLVVMGFSNQVLWLAAVALLYLYVRYGRTGRLVGVLVRTPGERRPGPRFLPRVPRSP